MNASEILNTYFLIISCVALIFSAVGAPIGKAVKNEDDFAVQYLSKYGYMGSTSSSSKSGSLTSQDSFKKAVKDFQAFAKINVTGRLDQETMELMKLPRCGVKDIIDQSSQSRKKRYALQGSRWRVRDLTYKVSKYPSDSLPNSDVDDVIKTAFQAWAAVTTLKFALSSDPKSHIDMRFENLDHNDGDPFDGPGGTLAHAYFPVYGGDVHFDNQEKWTTKTYKGTNFFQVAVHEFGHSLGLSHSEVKDALMGPFYRGYEPNFKLHQDDIDGIQALYGTPDGSSSGGTENTGDSAGDGTAVEGGGGTEGGGGGGSAGGDSSALCADPTFDAMINLGDDKTYIFKGNNYYRINADDQVEEGFPKSIIEDFGIEGNVDAAFTWKSKRTYIFKGEKYWRMSDMKLDSGYPKLISEGFKGIPNSVDAAFVWTGNDKIYFMKGGDYWKFDPEENPPVKSIYPKEVSAWKGLPNNIDAAVKYTNGKTYFFKSGQYYGFNDKSFAVDNADPPYPRPTGYWWFGCKDSSTLKKPEGLRRSQYKNVRGTGAKITRTVFDKNTINKGNEKDPLNKFSNNK